MVSYRSVIRRYVAPYKGYLGGSISANVLATLLNLLTFSLIMPILRILFGMEEGEHTYQPLSEISFEGFSTISAWGNALMNNFSYYVEQLIHQHGASTTLLILCLYLVGMTLAKVGVNYLGLWLLVPVRTGVVRDLRNLLNDKITAFPMAFMSDEHKGDILARISGDVTDVESTIVDSLEMIIKNPILLFIYILALFLLSWQLTLFVIVVLPPAGYIMGLIGKKLKRQSLESQNYWGALMSQVEETLGGLRIVKAFGAEEKIRTRFRTSNEGYRRLVSSVYRRQQLAHPVSEFLGTATIAIILWYGGSLILGGSSIISAPVFIYYLIVFYNIINPAKDFSKAVYSVQKGLASMERIERILEVDNPIKDPEEPKELHFEREIRFENVSFGYDAHTRVLSNLNLTIKKGQTVALVGSSGSGKSTLVDLIPRFWDVTEGSISIDGTDIREVAVRDLRALIGNVNQEPILFNDTIYNNIAFAPLSVTQEEVEHAATIANAHGFISRLPEGYQTNIGDRGNKLSGGERQRLSIARAILKNPPILILDEATSALDNESERLVQDAIEHLLRDRTTIVIAHRLSTIVDADVICVLDHGTIVEQGSHADLLALNGAYAKLYRLQVAREELIP